MRWNWRKRLTPLWIAVLLAVLPGSAVLAFGNREGLGGDWMPDLETDRKGSLTVCVSWTDDKQVKYVEGAEITISRVASVSVQNGVLEYRLLPEYDGVAVDFDGMTASESKNAAEILSGKTAERTADGQTAVTGSDGRAAFTELEQGMYLVVQTGRIGDAETYEPFTPFLIAVPLGERLESGNTWNYQVETDPKTEIVKKPGGGGNHDRSDPDSTPAPARASNTDSVTSVRTGDDSPVGQLLLLAVVCVVCLRRAVRRRGAD